MNLAINSIEKIKRSDSTPKTFSILIPTWNNLSYLQLCIKSLCKNSTYKHQILVHVNEGTDGTKEWIETRYDIDFTFSTTNIGICYALNTLRSMADTDYILYINDDMYVCPGWDAVLYDEIKTIGHKYFFLSCTAIEPFTQNICSIRKNYGTDIKSFDESRLLKEFDTLPFADWQGATWPPNIVHKDLWDTVGGYSIEFSPRMYSDPDFSRKLWALGVRYFKGLSKSRVYHFGSKTVKRIRKNPGYYTFISKWGEPSSTITGLRLLQGEPFKGPLPELAKPAFLLQVKNIFKRIVAAVKR